MRKSRGEKETPPTAKPPADPARRNGPAAEEAALDAAADKTAAGVAPEMETAEKQRQASPEEQLRAQLEEAKDRVMRIQAELENYRKRVARQKEEQRRYANLPLMRDLLPVLDNMERAIDAAEKTQDAAGLLEGFKMVVRQFEDVLARHHCVPIDALNGPFDPHLHQAISQQPSDEHPAGTVTLVGQTGFQLHDRVVRPSQVIISTAPERD